MTRWATKAAEARDLRGVAAIHAAMRYRIAVVRAAAGWGKTTAVRAAMRGIAHVWCDLAANADSLGALGTPEPSDDRWLVLDGVDRLSRPTREELFQRMRARRYGRWLLVARCTRGWPIAGWIASADAGAPVELSELALTAGEVASAATAAGVNADAGIVSAVTEMTGGWPVAVRFALAALERSADLSRVRAAVQHLFDDYAACEVFEPLSEERREFLYELALLGPADEPLLECLGRSDPAGDLAWLNEAGMPSVQTSHGAVLHELFARFLRRRLPRARARNFALRVADALTARGRTSASLELLRRYAPAEAVEALHAHGFALLESGCTGWVESIVRNLPAAVRRDDAIVTCLRAEIEAQTGALARANDLYDRAMELARDPLVRARVSRHRAVHYLNQGNANALTAIAPALDQGTQAERTDAQGIYAMGLSLTGAHAQALSEASAACAAATRIDDERLLARSMQRISYVHYQSGNVDDAERCGRQAADLAQRAGAWFHFICAHSILYAVAIEARDDHAAALWHARQIGAGAERTGDRRHRIYALTTQYVLEVERGREERALAIESEILPHSAGFRNQLECYVALATRRAWSGDFLRAYRQLATIGEYLPDSSGRQLWNGALAMFAAFAADERRATEHLRAVRGSQAPASHENAVANALGHCYAAFALVLLGHPERALRRLPRRPMTAQLRALASCARDLAELGASVGSATAAPALARLAENQQEGFGRALAVALDARGTGGTAPLLTAAERGVLCEMARGAAAAAIAQERGRSLHTVRNQIKSVTRKLGASGSIEAVARAKAMGLIE